MSFNFIYLMKLVIILIVKTIILFTTNKLMYVKLSIIRKTNITKENIIIRALVLLKLIFKTVSTFKLYL